MLCSAAALICAAPAAAADGIDPASIADADWTEVRTKHFTILTDAREGIAVSVGRRLEEFCVMMRILHPGLRTYPSLPTDVYVFRDRTEMARFTAAGVENVAGFSTTGPGRCVFVMNAEVEGSDRGFVVCHEFTHIFLGANFSDLPVWLDEGLAQCYETFRIRGRKAEYGHPLDGPSEWLEHHEWTSFEVLFAMNASAKAYQRDNDLRFATYAEGWAVAHYLLSDPGRAARFDSVLSAMRRGTPVGVAFRAQFPSDQWEAMRRDVQRYIHDAMLQPRSVGIPDLSNEPEPQSRPVPAATVLMRTGDLMLTLGPGRADDARALYNAALGRDAGLARAHAALGYLADRDGDMAGAEAAYAKAEGSAPRDARVALFSGLGTLRRVGFLSDRKAPEDTLVTWLNTARRRLAHALELEPTNPEALGAYGTTCVWLGDVPDSALAGLEAAVDSLPSYTHLKKALGAARRIRSEQAPAGGVKH